MVVADMDRHNVFFYHPSNRELTGVRHENVEQVIHFRDYLESTPSYNETFRIRQMYDGDAEETQSFDPDVGYIVGSWMLPEVYSGSSHSATVWVNPNCETPRRYCEAAVECECGAMVQQSKNMGSRASYTAGADHHDDCRVEYKLRATATLFERRREIFRRQALLGFSARSLAPRLGTKRNDVSHYASHLDLDYYDLRQRGYEKRANSVVELLEHYSTKTVARLYDVTPTTIRRIARETTGRPTSDFTRERCLINDD